MTSQSCITNKNELNSDSQKFNFVFFQSSKLGNLISHHWQMLYTKRENCFMNFTLVTISSVPCFLVIQYVVSTE